MKISVLIPCLDKSQIMQDLDSLKKDERIDEIVILENVRPIGKARNQLIKKAKNEFVLWFDSDVVIKNLIFLDSFEELIKKSKDIAGVSAIPLTVPSSRISTIFYINEELRRITQKRIFELNERHFNCSLFRRSALLEVGGFDEGLSTAEDNDMQIRLNQQGYKVLGLRDIIARHYANIDIGKIKKYLEGYKIMKKRYKTYEYNKPRGNLLKRLYITFKICCRIKKPHYFVYVVAAPAYGIVKRVMNI